jgi:mono/diheme cytochrome c family protein
VGSIRAVALVAATALAATFVALAARANDSSGPAAAPTKLEIGKRLYRKYCGQCHALEPALAVGFGTTNGLGTNGGPSLDILRVPYKLSVLSITLPFIGHETVVHKMTWVQIDVVSRYVETVTRNHEIVAQFNDG